MAVLRRGGTAGFGVRDEAEVAFHPLGIGDRADLASYDTDPGWYDNPPGTLASKATAAELARDGIKI